MFHIVGERNEKFKTQIFAKSQKTRIERIRQSAVERYEQPLFFAFVLGFSHVFFTRKRLVLDVGCGGGKNLQRILNHSKSINAIGIDISPHKRQNVRSQKSSRDKIGTFASGSRQR